MKKMLAFIKGARGFTMLELMMVIIIVGILAGLALPQYTGMVEKARAAEGIAMIGTIKNAEAAYQLQRGTYSSVLADLGITQPVGTYWTYGVAGAAATYTITATRSGKNASGHTSETITLEWTDGGSPPEVWGGNHPGKP